ANTPQLGLQMLAQNADGKRLTEQNAVAGDKPSGRGEAAMGGDEAGPRDAVAVEENAQSAGARDDRAVADFREAKALILVAHVRERKARAVPPLRDDRRRRRA